MLWAVIMAGGRGTRFWPESRNENPKQFLRIFGKKTLLEQTVDRLSRVIPRSRIVVVTQAGKAGFVRRLLRLQPAQVIGEPVGRNTAPCAILAASRVQKNDPDAVLAILPADHLIKASKEFCRCLSAAAKTAARSKQPVTFGIRPAFAFTGYGYLETGACAERSGKYSFYRVKRFYEKPSAAKAKRFFQNKRFLWNSGMFIWHAGALLEAGKRYLPKAYDLTQKINQCGLYSGMKRFFPKMPNISIDYGLMEKLKGNILSLPSEFGWNDVGGWQSLEDLQAKDKQGNVTQGSVVFVDSRKNIVKTSGRLVALVGIENCIIVETPDALLVCAKEKNQSIRQVVQALKDQKLNRYL